MSYDLLMFAPVAGEDPGDTYERLEEAADDAEAVPGAASRNRRIADALLAGGRGYSEFVLDHRLIAKRHGMPVDEARAAFRHVELSRENGLQITLHDREASITFPYWDSLDARQLVAEIGAASRLIAAETGWVLYDPQLEQPLDPVADAEAFAAAFGRGVEVTRGLVADDPPPGRPSVIRRLFGRRA